MRRPLPWPSGRPAVAATLALILAVPACSEPLDTTRQIPDRGTLGAEMHRLLHRDLAREAPGRGAAFLREREAFVRSIDGLFPPEELEATQSFLTALLPLYDDGALPAVTRGLGPALERFAEDPDALRALAVLLERRGYRSPERAEALVRRVVGFGGFDPLVRGLLEWVSIHDGREGAASDLVPRLQRELAARLAAPAPSGEGVDELIDLALRTDPRLAGDGPVWAVARDRRGVAVAAPRAPFADSAPVDGLPDLDELGRFVGGDGRPLDLRPFGEGERRDAAGRLLDARGDLVFRYVDLDRSVLARLLREGRAALDAELVDPALRLARHLVAPPRDPGVLTELVHAGARAVPPGRGAALLELGLRLVKDHQPSLAYLLLELDDALDRLDGASPLEPGSTLERELLAWTRRLLAEPDLGEALLDALESEEAQGLPRAIALLAGHKRARVTARDFDAGRVFTTPVDRGAPDRAGNLSLQQRLLHLIHDTKGARYVPRLIGVPLGFVFEIDDLAEFYLLSIIGETEVPAIVSTLTGLSRRPGPVELARFINEDQPFGNPEGNEGIDVKDNDGDTLFAVSASGMDAALAPLVRLFYDRGRLDLLFELLEILHLHWASAEGGVYQSADPRGRFYSRLSGVVRTEGALVEVMGETETWAAAQDVLRILRGLRPEGQPARTLLLNTARHVLRVDAALRTRAGRREVSHGGERHTALAPLDLLLAALEGLDRHLERRRIIRADADALLAHLEERFFGVEPAGPGAGRFTRPAGVAMLEIGLAFALEQLRQNPGWLEAQVVDDAAELLDAPLLDLTLEAAEALREDGRWRAPAGELAGSLLAESEGFDDLLVTLGDALGALRDRELLAGLSRRLGAELDPALGHRERLVTLLERTLALEPDAVDPGTHLVELLRRGASPRPAGGLVVYGVLEAVGAAQREDPRRTGALGGRDLGRISEVTARWLGDEARGLEKFFELVEERTLAGRAARARRPAEAR